MGGKLLFVEYDDNFVLRIWLDQLYCAWHISELQKEKLNLVGSIVGDDKL